MSDILVYKNKFWKSLHNFSYTGSPQKVTLEPGKYLFVCNGAKGGACVDSPYQNQIPHGGTSYGVLNLTQTKDFYAVVGGNGGDGTLLAPGAGGYNGGGTGGIGYSDNDNTYSSGGGGGGASDIRLINPSQAEPVEIVTEYTIPEEFQAIEYIQGTSGNQWIDTQYIHNTATHISCDIYTEDNVTHNGWETPFGARNNSMYYNAFYFFTTYENWYEPRWCRTNAETYFTNFPYNTKITLDAYGQILEIYDETHETLLNTVTTTGTNDNGVCTMTLFNLNISSNIKPSLYNSGSGCGYTGKMYGFRIYEHGEILHYFMPVRRKTETYVIDIDPSEFEQGTVGTSGDKSSSTRVRTKTLIRADNFKGALTFEAYDINDNPLQLCVSEYYYDNKESASLITDGSWNSMDGSPYTFTSQYTAYIRFILRRENSSDISPDKIKSLRITVSNCEAGMYDVITQTFHANRSLNGDFVRGSDIEVGGYEVITYSDTSTLSRIIVAGGAGGAAALNGSDASRPSYFGIGGGIIGSPVSSNVNDGNNGQYASQDYGYSFGTGMTPPAKVTVQGWGAEGAGGGGGGWYGGFSSSESDMTNTSCNGGGGSGYVLTADSYRPPKYDEYISSDYYFTDIHMTGGTAEESSVIIYKEARAVTSGDKLIFPCVGFTESIQLNSGNYKIKCVGGDGGVRYVIDDNNVGHGGYSEGILTLEDRTPVFVTVGGSGIRYAFSYQESLMCTPSLAFNGGGIAGDTNEMRSSFGGGGTDVRLLDNTLYHRLIVAGGAGGFGSGEQARHQYGGHGGGTTGGNWRGDSDYGYTPGPGTQTEAPQGSDVGGGFGYGGPGRTRSGGYGGAGGGGWYGGSGCYPDTSEDDDKGGCGGSGYVLTADSYKPTEYMLDENYYLTNAITSVNDTLHRAGQSYVEIIVNEVQNKKLLCYDAEGTKTWDDVNQTWTYVSSGEPTAEDFDEYGVYRILSDEGLLNEYYVYSYDAEGQQTASDAVIHVLPPQQKIICRERSSNIISDMYLDHTIDENNVDVNIAVGKEFIVGQDYLKFDLTVDISDVPDVKSKFYNIIGYSEGKRGSYHTPSEDHPILPKADLLSVGIGNSMPSRFKPYIGDSILDGSEAIATITSSVTCEHNRNIYSAVLCNDKIVRFTKLNLITNVSTIIRDVPKTSIGNTYYGGLLVDDEYMYITSSYNNSFNKLWRIPLDPTDDRIIELTAPQSYSFVCYGKMVWYNDNTILLLHQKRGYWLLNTEDLTWENYLQSTITDDQRGDFALGNRYMVSIYNNTSKTAWVVDIKTNTWYDLSDTYYTFQDKTWRCVCFNDGKFYFAQQNYIFVFDEADMIEHLENGSTDPVTVQRIPAIYGSLYPRFIDATNGFLYLSIYNNNSLYIYDINADVFRTEFLNFSNNSWNNAGYLYKPFVFMDYYFIGHLKLYVINCSDYCKYNIGYKYDIMYIPMNEDNEYKFTYDNRFVSFHDSYMVVEDGDITKQFTTVSETTSRVFVDKSEYNKFMKFSIVDRE